jgi:hypothetical protein
LGSFRFLVAIGFGRRFVPELGSFRSRSEIGFARRFVPELGSFRFLGAIGFARRFVRELGSFCFLGVMALLQKGVILTTIVLKLIDLFRRQDGQFSWIARIVAWLTRLTATRTMPVAQNPLPVQELLPMAIKKIVFDFDDENFKNLDEAYKEGRFVSYGQTVREALKLMRAFQEQAKAGFTVRVLRDPNKGTERVIKIPSLDASTRKPPRFKGTAETTAKLAEARKNLEEKLKPK